MRNQIHSIFEEYVRSETRRQFFRSGGNVLGAAALASLGTPLVSHASPNPGEGAASIGGLGTLPHFAPKAKRVIYLHMVGGPSQMDIYDYKPQMNEWYDKDLPETIRNGQRLTTMTSGQARFPIAPSMYKFSQHGKSGMWVTELLPQTAKIVDDLCFVRSMNTEAINHEPAITYMQTGNMVTGRPCIGAWLSYGLGSMNNNLPTFVVLVATRSRRGSGRRVVCPVNTAAVASEALEIRSFTSTILPECPPTSVARRSTGSNRSMR